MNDNTFYDGPEKPGSPEYISGWVKHRIDLLIRFDRIMASTMDAVEQQIITLLEVWLIANHPEYEGEHAHEMWLEYVKFLRSNYGDRKVPESIYLPLHELFPNPSGIHGSVGWKDKMKEFVESIYSRDYSLSNDDTL
jgi:hypothetical protein